MAGITDLPFRMICREMGAGLVFSEMVSVEALIREHRRTRSMLHTDPSERPVVFQIFGSKPESMAEAARIVSKGDVDFIDVNMGCPVPKVVKSGAGSALLRDIELAKAILSVVVEASKVPVTVKIRTGWDMKSIVAVDLALIAQDAGVSAVTVHGRTRMQGFSGHADWSIIKTVKDVVSIPVIGNGDVHTAHDAKRMIEETGCEGVMIGRAIQGNPWIFREAKSYLQTGVMPMPPSLEERKEIMLRHLKATVGLLGETSGVREMRKHLCWYTKGLRDGAGFRERVNQLSGLEEVNREIGIYFDVLQCSASSLFALSDHD